MRLAHCAYARASRRIGIIRTWNRGQRRLALSRVDRRTHGMPLGEDETIATLAEQTHTDEAVVQSLYAEELAVLDAQSTVKNFIGVIAARRVRERLTASRSGDSPSRPHNARAARHFRAA
jgi:hypothetical protein